MGFLDDAAALRDELVALRRELHAKAEVGLDLPMTQAVLLDALAGLEVEVTKGAQLTSVTAVLRGGRPGPAVLLRADMDGLPLAETTGLDFAAPGAAMHACGHDLHMAGLVGAARLLNGRRADLPGTVVLMFQPGEEGPGGARLMIEEGVLAERPVAAYALHVDSMRASGTFATRPGPMQAGSGSLKIRVGGTGGHPALPHPSVDPIPVAAEVVLAIQSFVTRRVPAGDPAVVSVTHLASHPGTRKALARCVDIHAHVRTYSEATQALIRDELAKLVTALGAAHGCTVETEFGTGYPPAHNDPDETARVLALLDERHGRERVERLAAPGTASEDFAYVLQRVPGTLFYLGARAAEGTAAPVHSPEVVFDEGVLPLQAATLADLAWNRLER